MCSSGESGELLIKGKLVQMMIRGEKLVGRTAIEKIYAGKFKSISGSFTYKKSTDSIIDKVCESGAIMFDEPVDNPVEKIAEQLGCTAKDLQALIKEASRNINARSRSKETKSHWAYRFVAYIMKRKIAPEEVAHSMRNSQSQMTQRTSLTNSSNSWSLNLS